jgi:hypothetical protein
MTLVEHARRELDALARSADADEGRVDEFQREINDHLLAMVALFSEAGHSGGSAGYAIGMLQRLLSFEPIGPLTGDDDEWMLVTDDNDRGPLEQNVRCSRIFREMGVAYDIEAVVYRERNGCGFTGWDSARRVTFPYTPKTREVPAWLRRPERLLARLRRQLRP